MHLGTKLGQNWENFPEHSQNFAVPLHRHSEMSGGDFLFTNLRKLSVTRTCIEWPLAYLTEH